MLLVVAASVSAISSFLKVFDETYKPAKESQLFKGKCLACHTAMKTKKNPLNPYGQDLKAALAGSKKLTAEVLHKIDELDSDKDGAKNIDEIKAGTMPGDPKSVP